MSGKNKHDEMVIAWLDARKEASLHHDLLQGKTLNEVVYTLILRFPVEIVEHRRVIYENIFNRR